MAEPLRCERLNTCKECGSCTGATLCKPAKKRLRNDYTGIRFTADGFDCALPVSIDSHTSCSYACMYCFSEYSCAGAAVAEIRATATATHTGTAMKRRIIAHPPIIELRITRGEPMGNIRGHADISHLRQAPMSATSAGGCAA